ncbi:MULTISPECIES: hypothetical protein [Chryseobacterium]|uniref:Uncharacterized protein n=1 Tax=Chryseobacterium gambrini TaxID=373672 RepID=A0AAJ1VIK6_9FLAO|nr:MULTISPECIES: hypothetical protein [Chryseobacterium]MDN4011313.1 hypothetical protein [Chryseobacterium gambrini]MDN4031084.1 hypothetical protein [Chryseobacterium gambrini]QWA38084.1 hypothetical protein KKI44_19665 [Chryseobacterium sp. ZHDP1]
MTKKKVKLYVEQRIQKLIKENNLKKRQKAITFSRVLKIIWESIQICKLLFPSFYEKEEKIIMEYCNERLKIAYSYIITLNK